MLGTNIPVSFGLLVPARTLRLVYGYSTDGRMDVQEGLNEDKRRTHAFEPLHTHRKRLLLSRHTELLDLHLLFWRDHHQVLKEIVLLHGMLSCGCGVVSCRLVAREKARTGHRLDQMFIILKLLFSLRPILLISIVSSCWCGSSRGRRWSIASDDFLAFPFVCGTCLANGRSKGADIFVVGRKEVKTLDEVFCASEVGRSSWRA